MKQVMEGNMGEGKGKKAHVEMKMTDIRLKSRKEVYRIGTCA